MEKKVTKLDEIAQALHEKRFLTSSEVKGMGYVNPTTAIRKLRERGMNIQKFLKGEIINGRKLEECEYHFSPVLKKEPADKWDKLKEKITDKLDWMIALECRGATYKALNWILNEMEALEQ